VNTLGIAVAGQTANLTPADKLLYALRDVTATVPSIPLIASSIMSKKLASGSDVIVLDVKVGDGAFMKTIEEAKKLSRLMVNIGTNLGRKVVAFITDMSQPLGFAVGNKLEVIEAIETLKGNGPDDLTTLSKEIGAHMIHLAEITNTLEEARTLMAKQIKNNEAHQKQLDLFKAQGGSLPSLSSFVDVKEILDVKAETSGYIKDINALTIGVSAMKLGAGRQTKEDVIDPDVGIVLNKKVGDYVEQGDTLAKVYNNKDNVDAVLQDILDGFEITKDEVKKQPIIFEIITA
jgi:pyrimidine-nucleoside phosphorylase